MENKVWTCPGGEELAELIVRGAVARPAGEGDISVKFAMDGVEIFAGYSEAG